MLDEQSCIAHVAHAGASPGAPSTVGAACSFSIIFSSGFHNNSASMRPSCSQKSSRTGSAVLVVPDLSTGLS